MEYLENIKVSIVIPVYNVPQNALRKCIESAMHQTMQEIEIILVDDGSTDSSGKICDEYASQDERITTIHKKNGGLSAARNSGYKAAKGEWITFVDGDDWIDEKTCESIYKKGVNYFADIVIYGTVQEFGNNKNIFKYHFENDTVFKGEECKKVQCEVLNFTGNIATAWGKLIRRQFLNENRIEHNEVLRQGSEGIEYNVRLFEKVKTVYFTDNVYYHYIYNPNSISAKHNEENHYYVIKCFEEIQRQIARSENIEALEKLFYNRFAYVIVATAISGYFSPENSQSYKEKKKSFKKYLNENLVINTLKRYDKKSIDRTRRFILLLIQSKQFWIISGFSLIRYYQKHK